MDLPTLPTDAPFDDIQRAVHGAGKAGAIQTLALMEKVAELLGQQNVFNGKPSPTLQDQRYDADRLEGWKKACAALLTIAQFLKEHAQDAPVRSVETGQIGSDGQAEEVVQHFDPQTIAQVIVEVVEALRTQG